MGVMSAESQQAKRIGELPGVKGGPIIAAVVTIIAVAVVYVLLLYTYLGPLNTFWTSDHGVKLFQTQSLILNKFRSNALVYPGQSIDPEQAFTPFRGQYLERNGQRYGMFSQAFAAVSAVPFFLWGYPGLYLIPVLAALAVLAIFFLFGNRLLHRWTTIGGALGLGLASPLLFYAINFWEHTLAAALVFMACFLSATALTGNSSFRAALAGVVLALAVAFRNETALFAPAVVLSIFLVRGLPALKLMIAFSLGMILGLCPLLIFNQVVYGTLLGPHVVVAGAGMRLSVSEWISMLVIPLRPVSLPLTIAALVVVRLAERFIPKLRAYSPLLVIALMIAVVVQCTASLGEITYTSLLVTFPFALLIALPLPERPQEQGSEHELMTYLQWVALLFVLLCLIVRLPDGGAQHGPRMLLPVMPPLLLVGLWRVEQWWRNGRAPQYLAATGVAVALIAHASLIAQADGLKFYQYVIARNHELLSSVAQSQEQIVITDTVYTPLLIGPLMYDGRLIFMVETGEELDGLVERLQERGISQFYYLGARPPEITEQSAAWETLIPVTERSAFAHRLYGQVLRLP